MFPRCEPPSRDIVAATCPPKCRPMRWPCRGDTGKLISPCSDGATCSRGFLRFDHEKRHHDKQQECGDQSIFERHGAYPSRKHSWARRCAAPALAGCAHAVSGHVAAVHIGSFLRRGNPDPRMSLVGSKARITAPQHCCPLYPQSTDIRPVEVRLDWSGWLHDHSADFARKKKIFGRLL